MDGRSFRFPIVFASKTLALTLGALIFIAPLCRADISSDETVGGVSADDGPPARSFQDTPEDVGYDSIVNSLNRQVSASEVASNRARSPKPKEVDPFENVMMHAGAGIAFLSETVDFADGNRANFNGRGFQASLGLDLFSPFWSAEGTVRSFDANEDRNVQMSLKEFELKLYYKDHIIKNLGYRFGGGISGRYLTVQRTGFETIQNSTPSSVLTAGLDFFITEKLSLGLDVSARTAMINETIDRSSIDGTVRVDAHF